MATPIPTAALSAIPYLNVDAVHSFTVWAQPLWDGTRFHQWAFDGQTMVELAVADWIDGMYFAEHPASAADTYLPFLDALVRFAPAPGTSHWFSGILGDIGNIAAALWRNQHLANGIKDTSVLRALAACEYEFVLGACRSMFDCLQEAIRALWEGVKLTDAKHQKGKRELPKTFSGMCLRADQPIDAADHVKRYQMPVELAAAYQAAAKTFAAIRHERDRLLHGGHSAPPMFLTERGLGIDADATSQLVQWRPEELLPNNIGSFGGFLAKVVQATLDVCTKITFAYFERIAVPPALIKEPYRIYYRSPVSTVLNQLGGVCNGTPWQPFVLSTSEAKPN